MEAFTYSVALRAFYFCFGVLNIFDSQVEFIFMILSFSAIFGAAIGKDTQQWNFLFLEEWNDFVVYHICCGDGVLTIIQLGKSNLRIGIDEGLLIDSPYAFDIANVVGILCTQVPRMLSLNLSESFALFSLTLHGDHLCFGENDSFLSNLCFKCSKSFSESLQVVALPYATNASRRNKHTTLTEFIGNA